jgi:hypothetical protein
VFQNIHLVTLSREALRLQKKTKYTPPYNSLLKVDISQYNSKRLSITACAFSGDFAQSSFEKKKMYYFSMILGATLFAILVGVSDSSYKVFNTHHFITISLLHSLLLFSKNKLDETHVESSVQNPLLSATMACSNFLQNQKRRLRHHDSERQTRQDYMCVKVDERIQWRERR